MAKHKVVIVTDQGTLTGEALEQVLRTMDFSIPEIVPVSKLLAVPRPTGHQNTTEMQEKWKNYSLELKAAYDNYKADMNRFNAEIAELVEDLEGIFEIHTLVHVGNLPNGQKKWEIVKKNPPAYNFNQVARKLVGPTAPLDVIEFICYSYFGG